MVVVHGDVKDVSGIQLKSSVTEDDVKNLMLDSYRAKKQMGREFKKNESE